MSPQRNSWANCVSRPEWEDLARQSFGIYAGQPNRQQVAMRSFDQLLAVLAEIPVLSELAPKTLEWAIC